MKYPEPISKLIDSYMMLPGIGRKTATRMAFFTLGLDKDQVQEFANNLINIANNKRKAILIDFDLSEELFLDNIQYLFAIDLINRKELEELKSEYKLKQLL